MPKHGGHLVFARNKCRRQVGNKRIPEDGLHKSSSSHRGRAHKCEVKSFSVVGHSSTESSSCNYRFCPKYESYKMGNARREYVVGLRIDRITTELLNTQSLRCAKVDPRMNGNHGRSPPAGIRCVFRSSVVIRSILRSTTYSRRALSIL